MFGFRRISFCDLPVPFSFFSQPSNLSIQMDPNSSPATSTNATDSSSSVVTSLVSSCGQLEMVPVSSGSGPINRMPNELMQQILTKLAWDDDANRLVRLRLVSKWWSFVVECYCRPKKCLFISDRWYKSDDLVFSTPLIVHSKSIDFLGTILKLFPNTEKLAICNFADLDHSQMPIIAAHINSMSSLKQLQLFYDLIPALPYLSQTLSRLEHIALVGQSGTLDDDEAAQFVSQLGPNCVRAYFGSRIDLFNFQFVLQWPTLNPQWLAKLTHLQMVVDDYECACFGKVVRSLGEHATSLEYLDFTSTGGSDFQVTLPVIRDLGALTNLTELKLLRIALDIAQLDQEATQQRLPTLPTVLACYLFLMDGPKLVNTNSFTRVLSVIFPNLTDLKLEIGPNLISLDHERIIRRIELYLDRFPNLLKHTFEYHN